MAKKSTPKKNKKLNQQLVINQSLALTGAFSGLLAIGVFIVLLLEEPAYFDAKLALVLLSLVVFITSLAPAQYLAARKATTKVLVIAGTIMLAIVFTLVGLLLMTGAMWLVGLLHV